MSDRDTLRLKRALADDPSDAVALEALAAARTRAGRGWADEPLPLDLRCSPKERGVYVWTRHGLGLEMVRVPGESSFTIGRYPVTWREFLGFCDATGRPYPAMPDGADREMRDRWAANRSRCVRNAEGREPSA